MGQMLTYGHPIKADDIQGSKKPLPDPDPKSGVLVYNPDEVVPDVDGPGIMECDQ